MAITKHEFLYELLVRFNADGFQGAHQKNIVVYTDGDQIISAQEGDALPLTAEAVAGLMDAQLPGLTAEIAALNETIAGLKGLVGVKDDLVTVRDREIAAARDALAAVQVELEAAKRDVPAAPEPSDDAAVGALRKEVAGLHASAAAQDASLTAANERIALVSAMVDERDRELAVVTAAADQAVAALAASRAEAADLAKHVETLSVPPLVADLAATEKRPDA